ncbi:MAG: ribosome recycling factor [Anaerolineae bacterium]
MVDLLMDDAKERMKGAVEALDADLSGYRTGRASTALVERLDIEYYGTPTPLNQMATITVPEPRLIAIRVWDTNAVRQVEKGIMASDLGLTPSVDGQVVRLPIPALTEERREELTKLASRRVEEARVAIRNVRRDVLHHLEDLDLPEDRLYDLKDDVQEMTDKHIEQADAHGEAKFAEIREV